MIVKNAATKNKYKNRRFDVVKIDAYFVENKLNNIT